MQTLQIKIPEGFEVEDFNKSTGEVTFREKPKTITERVKTFDDVLRENDIDKDDFEACCEGLSTDEKAYRMIVLLTKTLNEGWEPDWDDSNQPKYFPWFDMGGSSGFRFRDFDGWRSCSHVGSRLCLKSRELCEYAGKQFTNVYKQFMI